MAHSIQVFEKRSKSFNDLDLLIVITFVLEMIAKEPDQFGLSKVCDHWKGALRSYGPGVLDLEFESLIRSQSDRCLMAEIFDKVREELEAFGTKIPATVLRERVQIPGVKFHDYPVVCVAATATDLKALLLVEPTVPGSWSV
jgi:hypothetical protein